MIDKLILLSIEKFINSFNEQATVPFLLTTIAAEQLAIEADLRTVMRKSYSDWIPADVYASLREGKAELVVAYKKEQYAGFLVLSMLNDFSGEKKLFIWVAYANPKYNIVAETFKFLDNIAENSNLIAIEFDSSRSGWMRTAKQHGYEAITRTYRKEV